MNDHRLRIMRPKEDTLAFPKYLCSNAVIHDKLVHSIVIIYQEDVISRMRANSRDVVQTQSEVCVRFMEMTLLEVLRECDTCFSGFVGCSTFYLLRIRHVKIVTSGATRLSIYHEYMQILPTVSAICISYY